MADTAVLFDVIARDRASAALSKVSRSFDDAGRRGSVASGRLEKAYTAAGRTIRRVSVGAALGIAGIAASAATVGLKTAAGMEQARISFTTMLGSAQKADAFIRQLAKFAAATPFDFPGLQQAASSLISAGIDADKVIPIMRTLGDVTSGMGTGAEGIQRATIALQQMNAAGKITGEDLNQLRDAGIPVYDLLSKATGKSKAEVVALAQKGKLGADALRQMMKALETGKGLERFNGLMAKQSQSLTGLVSTLKDNVSQGLAKMIEPALPAIKVGLQRLGDFAQTAFTRVGAFIKQMQTGDGPGGKFAATARRIWSGLGAVAGVLRDKVIPAIGSFVGWLRDDLWPAIKAAFVDSWPRIKIALDFLSGAFKTGEGTGGRFSTVMRTIGDIIIKYVVPALAKFAEMNFVTAVIALGGVVHAVRGIWTALTYMGKIMTHVTAVVVRAALQMFGTLINGAAAAFGWVPGIGPKLQGAAAKFNVFRGQAETALQGIENAAYDLANGAQAYGTAWAQGLARGISNSSNIPIAKAQGVANKVAAMMRSQWQVQSPSKVAAKIGMYFGHGLAVGITKGGSKAVAAAKSMAQKVADQLNAGIQATVDRISATKDRIADLKSQFADISNGIRDAIRGGLDLSQLTNSTSLAAGFAAYRSKLQAFSIAIRKMIAQHYPSTLIQQIAAMGPDGLATAQAFAGANVAQRKQIVGDFNAIGSASTSLGNVVARTTSLDEQIRHQYAVERNLTSILSYQKALLAEARREKVAEITADGGRTLARIVDKAHAAAARAKRAK